MKKNVIVVICVVVVITLLIVCNLQKFSESDVTSLHIASDVVRLESDMAKRLSVTVYPENASQDSYKLVSENEFVAVCDGSSVVAVNEGETFVYAVSPNGKIESNKVKVVVSNSIFEVAAKIIMASMDEQTANEILTGEIKESENVAAGEKDKLSKVEVTSKAASQITGAKIGNVPETFEVPTLTDENANDTVYITKSGEKFHSGTCAYAKGATAVPRSQAVADGKTPCKKCKP